MFNKLESIIKKLDGNVLTIGLDSKLISKFDNNKIASLYSIDKAPTNFFSKGKKRNTNKGKTINIKRLKKYINKKSVDYIICNMNEIVDYYKYFIRDSIYLNRNTIYIYSTNDIDKEFIIERYERYKINIKSINYKNGYIIIIDNKNGKNNFFMDKLYFIKDTFYNIAELIGNILIN